MPGNIRRAEHFIAFLQRFLQHLRTRLQVNAVVSDTPTSFLQVLQAVSERATAGGKQGRVRVQLFLF